MQSLSSVNNVAVLLSTKNGQSFIREQVASIMAQTHRHKRLFWRDDGSTDATVAIMREVFHLAPLSQYPLGITESYANLFRAAWEADYQMFALADQDDVWAIDKLERGVMALTGIAGPAIYCARQAWVDHELRRFGTSPPFREPIGFPAALTQNIATGCTTMLNREAARLVCETLDDQQFHDWWCYLIVSAAGGRVITDDATVIQYRQHAGNVIGAPANDLRRSMNAVRRGPTAFMGVMRRHVAQLEAHIDLLSPKARDDLAIIAAALQNGWWTRWQALRLPGFHRQTRREDLLFRLWFLLG